MKTAMQTMIEYLQSNDVQKTITTQWHIARAKELLIVEEKQLIEAYDDGFFTATNLPSLGFGEEYYNKTFKNK